MKNTSIFTAILIFTLVTFGCSSDDDNHNAPQNLVGSWHLVKTTGTIAGINHEFAEGTIIWTFNTNNTVTVVNNNENESLQSGFESGTYSYNVGNNPGSPTSLPECAKYINISTDEFNCMVLEATELEIREGIADGINYHFKKDLNTID